MPKKSKKSIAKIKTKKSNANVNKSSSKNIATKDKMTRVDILRAIVERVALTRTQVEAVFNAMADILQGHLKKRGSGECIVPFLGIKVRRVKKKATKTRTMVSPLTGQEVVIQGKPARSAVKISALKVLKSAVLD